MNDTEPSGEGELYLRAINLLARRDHSAAELKRKLATRGYPAAAIAEVLEKLAGEGYLDDRRFAERWAESALQSGRGYGLRIMQELQRRGIPREIASGAVAGATIDYPEQEALAAIVSRRFATFDPANAPLKEKQRVYSYLLRRGFSLQAINSFFKIRTEEFD